MKRSYVASLLVVIIFILNNVQPQEVNPKESQTHTVRDSEDLKVPTEEGSTEHKRTKRQINWQSLLGGNGGIQQLIQGAIGQSLQNGGGGGGNNQGNGFGGGGGGGGNNGGIQQFIQSTLSKAFQSGGGNRGGNGLQNFLGGGGGGNNGGGRGGGRFARGLGGLGKLLGFRSGAKLGLQANVAERDRPRFTVPPSGMDAPFVQPDPPANEGDVNRQRPFPVQRKAHHSRTHRGRSRRPPPIRYRMQTPPKPGGIYGEGSPSIDALWPHPARHHEPISPKFDRLFSHIIPIIPAEGSNLQRFGPLMKTRGVKRYGPGFAANLAGLRQNTAAQAADKIKKRRQQKEQEFLFLRNVLQMIGQIVPKMRDEGPTGEDRLKLVEDIDMRAKTILDHIDEKGSLPKRNMSELVLLFNKAFSQMPENNEKTNSKGLRTLRRLPNFKNRLLLDQRRRNLRAPYCPVGRDCFDDVDHLRLAMDIKRLALALTRYMRKRMLEEEEYSDPSKSHDNPYSIPHRQTQYATDSVLTQAIAIVAKLHRSVMRNWHQMRMLLHNLAGGDKVAKLGQDIGASGPKTPDSLMRLHRHELFRCELTVKGEGDKFKERPHWCRAGKGWFKDTACRSPITNPSEECTPQHSSSLYFQRTHGQFALTIPFSGKWDFMVKASIQQGEGMSELKGVHIRGSVDKVLHKKNNESSSIQTLAVLDQTAKFPRESEMGSKVNMEAAGSASFKRGERLLLRTALSREDLQVTLTVRFNPIKTKEEKMKKEEEEVKHHRKNGIVDENSHVDKNGNDNGNDKNKNESVTTIVDKNDGAVLVDGDNDTADDSGGSKTIINESGASGPPRNANQTPGIKSGPKHGFGHHNDEEKDLEIEEDQSDEDEYGDDDDNEDDTEDDLDDYDDDEDDDEEDDDIKTQTKLITPKPRLLNQDMSNNIPM